MRADAIPIPYWLASWFAGATCGGFRHLSRSVRENDLASTTARRGRKRDGVSDVACADDAELHCSAPVLTHML